MIWAGVALIVLMALLGAPLFVVVLAAAMLGLLATGVDPAAVAISIYEITHQPLLVALPFFTFAGYLMAAARTSERLMALTQALFGWMPAGLAVVGFVACALFTALTGASGVTIVALGGLLLPMLVSSGYSERFSLGLVTTSGSLGLLLVPSVPLILYGVVAQQLGQGEPFTIQQMFIAGLGPTLLMVVLLSCYATLVHAGAPRTPFNGRALVKALKASRWELPLPVIVLGGIYSGYFAISEAAAMTAVYIFVAEVLLYREIKWRNLPSVIRESMVMVGSILLILGVALAFTNYLVDAEVPQRLFAFMQEHVSSKYTFLILLNIMLLALGAILGHLLGAGHHGATAVAGGGGLRHPSSSLRRHLPRQLGDWLLHAAHRHQPVHLELSLRPAYAGPLRRLRAISARDAAGAAVDHLCAVVLAVVPMTAKAVVCARRPSNADGRPGPGSSTRSIAAVGGAGRRAEPGPSPARHPCC